MAATVISATRQMSRLPVSSAWWEAGFTRTTAEMWRRAGWDDATVAADWSAASPSDQPDQLRELSDAGYEPDQLRRTGELTRRHIAAWTAVTTAPAAGGAPSAYKRVVVASTVLERLSADLAGHDVVIDLREPTPRRTLDLTGGRVAS